MTVIRAVIGMYIENRALAADGAFEAAEESVRTIDRQIVVGRPNAADTPAVDQ